MFKVIVVNIVVFSILFVLGDLSLGWVLNDPVKYMCRDTRLHHRYCPGSTRIYRMSANDDDRVFTSHWNQQGLRVASPSEFGHEYVSSDYDVINIGDSFMAQRQVEHDERVASYLEEATGLRVLQVGVGSWSVVNYRNWIEDHAFKQGAVVNVFLMANDVYAFGYGLSNARYHATAERDGEKLFWQAQQEETTPLERFLINRSFTWQQLNHQLRVRDDSAYLERYQPLARSFPGVQRDCALLEQFPDITPYARSCMVLAFDRSCWPDELLENHRTVVTDLRAVRAHLAGFQARLQVVVIPNGWALPGESMSGKQHPRYQIEEDVVISMEGYTAALRADLDVPVISLEESFRALKAELPPADTLYYSDDAHWNSLGSRTVAEVLAKSLHMTAAQ